MTASICHSAFEVTMSGPHLLDQLKAEVRRQDHRLEPARTSIRGSKSRRTASSTSASICATSPTCAFDYLNCITGVDYLQPDEKKAAKSEWQPHTEVVYHLFSMQHKHSLVLKVMLPRWKDDKPGELPEVPTRRRRVEHGRLARARSATTCPACTSPATRTCGASSAPKIGSAIRCARTTKCRWSTTAFAEVKRLDRSMSCALPSTIRASSSSTSARTRCSSTWGRSIPARTACCGWCCGPTAKSSPKSTPHIGYLHRCAEKIGENLTPRQWIPYTDRMDYLAGMNMNLGWSLCVEKLMNYRVPEKGRHLRVIIAELGRIASHLVGMGAYGLDLGTFSPFLYAFREREKILDLFEEACGARLTYSYLTPGGATADLPPRLAAEVRGVPRPVRADHPGVSHAAHDQRDLRQAHGRTSASCRPRWRSTTARSGPVLRGSGVDHDLRRDGEEIYTAMYDGYAFEVICRAERPLPEGPRLPGRAARGGARRLLAPVLRADAGSGAERSTSCRQAIDRYSTATGSYGEPIKLTAEAAQGRSATWKPNAPRGQMGFYLVSDGELDPLAGPRPQQQLLQPVGHQRAVPRLPDRRRAGDRRLARHRDGRDRSVTVRVRTGGHVAISRNDSDRHQSCLWRPVARDHSRGRCWTARNRARSGPASLPP